MSGKSYFGIEIADCQVEMANEGRFLKPLSINYKSMMIKSKSTTSDLTRVSHEVDNKEIKSGR